MLDGQAISEIAHASILYDHLRTTLWKTVLRVVFPFDTGPYLCSSGHRLCFEERHDSHNTIPKTPRLHLITISRRVLIRVNLCHIESFQASQTRLS